MKVVQAQDPAEEMRSQRPQQLASHYAPRRAPEDHELSYRATAASLLKIVGTEEQYGFLVGRGTTDGVLVVKEATNKRRNAGEDSWVLFVDLDKAKEGEVLNNFGQSVEVEDLAMRLLSSPSRWLRGLGGLSIPHREANATHKLVPAMLLPGS